MFNGTAVVNRFAVRRVLVLSGLILGLAAMAPAAANATIASVFGTVTCATQGAGASEGQRWCGNTAGTTVPSWDGTPIDVSAAFPPASGADNNYPVIGIYHGWGSSKILPSSAAAQRWLKLGYAVFSITDRGWFSSCGATVAKEKPGPCEKGYVHLMSRAYEVHDAQYLLGLLADEGVINPQQIGATGESYGGGMSEQLGSLKDRVQLTNGELIPWVSPKGTSMKIAATAPEWPWTDLAQSLQPNGSNLDYVANAPYAGILGNHEYGIQKQNWNESLYLAGLAIFKAFYAPAPAEPEANITEWFNFNSTGGPYNGQALAIQQEEQLPNHSPYYTSLSEPPAPALLQNGWNDDLFPVDESVDYYNKVRSVYPNAPIKLFAFDFGHNPRSTSAASTTDVGKLTAAQNAWFEFYVKGQGSEPAAAHGGVTAITSVCPTGASSSGHEYTAANWASLAPGEIRLEGAAEQTIEAPGTAPASPFTAGGTNVCSEQNAGNNASAATYKLAPAPSEGFTIAGSPTVIAEVSTPSTNDQIIGRLYDVNEGGGGVQRLIGRAIYRPLNPGGGFTKQVFQLHPQAWNVAAGHVVKLELLIQDSKYAHNSSSPQSIHVKNLELRLPTIEPPGSDGGLVQAPLPKYLPPAYTLARNVPTTVPGVPHISSGTNPNGGVFTLAWEPSAAAAGLTYTLQHEPMGGGWSTVASGLTSPEFAFTAGSKEEQGVWTYRVSASNESAESEFSGPSAEVTVTRGAPTVVTGPASAVTQTTATLTATVNPNEAEVSKCEFEYGETIAYGSTVPCTPAKPGSGTSPVEVSAEISGLTANKTYHFRISATNSGGTSKGSDETFKTSAGSALCGPSNSPGGQGAVGICNWYNTNTIVPPGKKEVIFMSGGFTNANLSQTSALGEISCKTVDFGTVENPAGGGAGVGKIFGFGFYSCAAPKCEAEAEEQFGKPGRVTVTALNLPWNQSLGESGAPAAVRDHIGTPFSGIFGAPSPGEADVKVVCEVVGSGQPVKTANFEGELEPEIGIGTGLNPGLNGSSPAETSFTGASSGALHSEMGGESTFAGSLKYVEFASFGHLEVW
jgi:hypothetical protein